MKLLDEDVVVEEEVDDEPFLSSLSSESESVLSLVLSSSMDSGSNSRSSFPFFWLASTLIFSCWSSIFSCLFSSSIILSLSFSCCFSATSSSYLSMIFSSDSLVMASSRAEPLKLYHRAIILLRILSEIEGTRDNI